MGVAARTRYPELADLPLHGAGGSTPGAVVWRGGRSQRHDAHPRESARGTTHTHSWPARHPHRARPLSVACTVAEQILYKTLLSGSERRRTPFCKAHHPSSRLARRIPLARALCTRRGIETLVIRGRFRRSVRFETRQASAIMHKQTVVHLAPRLNTDPGKRALELPSNNDVSETQYISAVGFRRCTLWEESAH